MSDLFAMAALLVRQHRDSRYAGLVAVDEPAARRLLAQFVQRHGGIHDGGAFVVVAEDGEGVIRGFVVGVLDRVYHIGDRLTAQDVFLVADPDAPAPTARRLLGEYLAWADSVPDCAEVRLSWTDALPSGPRMGRFYEHLGFHKVGEIWERAPAGAPTGG